jgi:hypothetical protein
VKKTLRPSFTRFRTRVCSGESDISDSDLGAGGAGSSFSAKPSFDWFKAVFVEYVTISTSSDFSSGGVDLLEYSMTDSLVCSMHAHAARSERLTKEPIFRFCLGRKTPVDGSRKPRYLERMNK